MTEAACWAHARRKFVDLHELHQSPVAAEALDRIGALYAIEAEIRGGSPDERRAVRQERSRPLLDALHSWFEQTHLHTFTEVGDSQSYPLRAEPLGGAGAILRRRPHRD